MIKALKLNFGAIVRLYEEHGINLINVTSEAITELVTPVSMVKIYYVGRLFEVPDFTYEKALEECSDLEPTKLVKAVMDAVSAVLAPSQESDG